MFVPLPQHLVDLLHAVAVRIEQEDLDLARAVVLADQVIDKHLVVGHALIDKHQLMGSGLLCGDLTRLLRSLRRRVDLLGLLPAAVGGCRVAGYGDVGQGQIR